MNQLLGMFGLLDFTTSQPILTWHMFWNLRSVHFFNFQIFFFYDQGKPRIPGHTFTCLTWWTSTAIFIMHVKRPYFICLTHCRTFPSLIICKHNCRKMLAAVKFFLHPITTGIQTEKRVGFLIKHFILHWHNTTHNNKSFKWIYLRDGELLKLRHKHAHNNMTPIATVCDRPLPSAGTS
jgi:hypothetical protein